MTQFFVWDPDNESEEHASLIDAGSAEDAAGFYAERDSDGKSDGLYVGGHDLSVRQAGQPVVVVNIRVEYEPVFYAKRQ